MQLQGRKYIKNSDQSGSKRPACSISREMTSPQRPQENCPKWAILARCHIDLAIRFASFMSQYTERERPAAVKKSADFSSL